jgi:hypothetical protein
MKSIKRYMILLLCGFICSLAPGAAIAATPSDNDTAAKRLQALGIVVG